MKLNCWEVKNCGRQPGGEKSKELGVCPATINCNVNGINNGLNGGRACWAIPGTLCMEKVACTFSQKLGACHSCDFYNTVRSDERVHFKTTNEILDIL